MIPVYQPVIAKNQIAYVNECLTTNWISSRGTFVDRFEQALCNYFGSKHCITTFNGTVSLSLIIDALSISKKRIGIPSLTYAATGSAVLKSGATLVLLDSDENFQLDTQAVKKNARHINCLLVPQLYGGSPDMEELVEICKFYNIILIEDSAEAFGCKRTKHIGTYGAASSFSLFSNKVITSGEGGFILTDNDDLAKEMRLLKNHYHTGNFFHGKPGFNFRMTNIQAAIGLAQLEEIDSIITRKKYIDEYYKTRLSKQIRRTAQNCDSSCWMSLFLLPDGYTYPGFNHYMAGHNIDVRPCFTPISKFKWPGVLDLTTKDLPFNLGFNLPSYPDLSEMQLVYISSLVNKYVEQNFTSYRRWKRRLN